MTALLEMIRPSQTDNNLVNRIVSSSNSTSTVNTHHSLLQVSSNWCTNLNNYLNIIIIVIVNLII